MPGADDFEAATERFLEWFKSIGGEFRDDLIAIKDLRERNAGRGISKNQFGAFDLELILAQSPSRTYHKTQHSLRSPEMQSSMLRHHD